MLWHVAMPLRLHACRKINDLKRYVATSKQIDCFRASLFFKELLSNNNKISIQKPYMLHCKQRNIGNTSAVYFPSSNCMDEVTYLCNCVGYQHSKLIMCRSL